jgi:serine protease Do
VTLRTLIAVLILAVPALAPRAAFAQAGAMVWCHDPARSLVRQTAPGDCDGQVVDAAEAARIKAERIDRIRRRMQGKAPAVRGARRRGSGTGFFVTADGHVVTNNHVIDGCKGVTVIPPGQAEVKADVLATDPGHDLALLKAEAKPSGTATFRNPPTLHQGEDIAVVGYPLHGLVAIKPIMVKGQVYVGTQPPRPDMFAMSIDIRRGNSGGPVVDRAGRIVGVVVAKVNTPGVFAATGQVVRDIGYGIRLTVALDFLKTHGVGPAREDAFEDRKDEALFERVRGFVARIGCWR